VSETRSFTSVCERLDSLTKLDRLEARGTVRLALKEAGIDPAAVSPREMSVVLEKVLPAELRARGVASPESICRELAASLSTLPREEGSDSPDRIFARLAGSPNRA
jgi:hypothetical protein